MPTEAIFDQLATAKTSDEVKSILDGANAKIVYSTETSAAKGAGADDAPGDSPPDPMSAAAEGDVPKDDGPPSDNPFAKKKGSGLKDAKKAAIDKAMPEGF